MTTKNDWVYLPETGDQPAAYKRRSKDMLVIQRGPASWDAYYLRLGTVVEGVFVNAAQAIEWCDGRVA